MKSAARCLFALLAFATFARAMPVDTSTVVAPDGSLSFLARPATRDLVRRPALVLAPEWWGVNDYALRRAREFAARGFVVLVPDFYGSRRVAADREEAARRAGAFYGDPSRFRAVAARAVAQLASRPDVDTARLGALGFCFGGTAVLEGARAGQPFKAVASFHGNPQPFAPTPTGAVAGRLLVLHGGADRAVPMEAVSAFVADAESARMRYELAVYAGAVHGFTNPGNGDDPSRGVAYDPAAERAAFAAFDRLLAETGLEPSR